MWKITNVQKKETRESEWIGKKKPESKFLALIRIVVRVVALLRSHLGVFLLIYSFHERNRLMILIRGLMPPTLRDPTDSIRPIFRAKMKTLFLFTRKDWPLRRSTPISLVILMRKESKETFVGVRGEVNIVKSKKEPIKRKKKERQRKNGIKEEGE